MTNLNYIIASSSVMWIKRYLDNHDRNWKHTFEHLSEKNLQIFLSSNFDTKELPSNLPSYYSNAFQSGSMVSSLAQKSLNSISSCLWYNKNIRIGGKSIFNSNLFSIGNVDC